MKKSITILSLILSTIFTNAKDIISVIPPINTNAVFVFLKGNAQESLANSFTITQNRVNLIATQINQDDIYVACKF